MLFIFKNGEGTVRKQKLLAKIQNSKEKQNPPPQEKNKKVS